MKKLNRKGEKKMYEELKELPDYTPNYVIDEVKYYLDKINQGKSDCFTLDNAISLVNLAKANNSLTEEEAKAIKESIKRIKERK